MAAQLIERRTHMFLPTTCQRHLHKAPPDREARFREIAANAGCMIVQIDPRGNISFFNDHAEKVLGFSAEDVVGKNVVGTIVATGSESARSLQRMLTDIHENPEHYTNVEMENVRRSGEPMWVLWANRKLTNKNGTMTGVLSVGTDITGRRVEEEMLKQCCASLEDRVNERTAELTSAYAELQRESHEREWAERILRDSEKKYRLVVENASEAIVVIQDHHIKYFNPRTLKVMNQPAAVLTAKPVDDFIHPEDRDTARQRRLKMQKGETVPRVYSLRIIDKNGTVRWLELNSVLITWMGRPAILAFFNNISERKRAEEEVKVYQDQLRSLASELSLAEERERRSLATDLHDHIGQTLAIINMKLGALRQDLDGCGDEQARRLGEQAGYIQSLVEETVHHTRSLTFQLSPPMLYEIGFEATLGWFGELIEREHHIAVAFDDDGSAKPLDRDVSVLMFKAVRELLMNVVKHARARNVRMTCERVRNTMRIGIEDDGVGFDVSSIGSTTFGFFSVRERLKHFEGTLHIDANPGQGTRITLFAPIQETETERAEAGL